MKILVDVMGGDNAPEAAVLGALNAASEYKDMEILMVGNEDVIRDIALGAEKTLDLENVDVVHTTEVITMEDPALSVVREKSNSSMSVCLHMLAEGKADAFVSAGNTGALHAGSSLIVRRIKGIQRSAIASVLPFANPTLLIDSGANIDVEPSYLQQFAIMGSIYMHMLFGVDNPRVGLLNNGTEKTKGTKQLLKSYELLESDESINFIGNVEGKEVPFGKCDVLVTDGFSGNVFLKTSEGMGLYLMTKLKEYLTSNILTKASTLIIGGKLKQLKSEFDASEYGGAPLLGLSKPVLKAHGSSDAKAFKNAIRKAADFAETQVVVEIAKWISADKEKKDAANNESNNEAKTDTHSFNTNVT